MQKSILPPRDQPVMVPRWAAVALLPWFALLGSSCRSTLPPDPRLPRAEAYTRAESWDEAAGLWGEIYHASGGQDLRAGLESADALARAGLVGVSRSRLLELEARFGKRAEVHEALGHAHVRAGSSEEALASFQRALELDPGRPGALAGAGVLGLGTEGASEGAARTLARLGENGQLGAVGASALLELGEAAALGGAFEDAFAAFHAAVQSGELGSGEVVRGARSLSPDPRTIPWLTAVVRDDPLHTEALTLLGTAQLKSGRTTSALATLQEAASSDPGDVKAMRAYAGALTAAGRDARAAEIWAALGEAPPEALPSPMAPSPPPGSSP